MRRRSDPLRSNELRKVLWDPQGLIAGGAMTDEFALRHGPRGATGPVAQICCSAQEATKGGDKRSQHDSQLLVLHHQLLCLESQPYEYTHQL